MMDDIICGMFFILVEKEDNIVVFDLRGNRGRFFVVFCYSMWIFIIFFYFNKGIILY